MFTTRITLTIIGAVLLALGVDGCGQAEDDTCSPTPDGYYQASPTTPGYTFVNGLPVAFVGSSCQSMALPRRWRWPSEGPDRRRDPLPSPGGAPCLRARRVSGRGLVLLAGERGGVMKPGLLLWRKDGFA